MTASSLGLDGNFNATRALRGVNKTGVGTVFRLTPTGLQHPIDREPSLLSWLTLPLGLYAERDKVGESRVGTTRVPGDASE